MEDVTMLDAAPLVVCVQPQVRKCWACGYYAASIEREKGPKVAASGIIDVDCVADLHGAKCQGTTFS